MPQVTGGGSLVSGGNIVDGTVGNADIAAAAEIAQSKIAGGLEANTDLIHIETGTSFPYSLTTVANQKVLVMVSGNTDANGVQGVLQLFYNGVEKARQDLDADSGSNLGFCIMYVDEPGAATQDLTLSIDQGATLANLRVVVIKIKLAP